MICPKCNGTGKVNFSYTQRCNVLNICNYEGCVGGIINCCGGVQEQPDEADKAIDETHKGIARENMF